jgi:Tfp pilus assembly protein FimV
MSIDWLNPTTEMLAGLNAGRSEQQVIIDQLQEELAQRDEQLAKARAFIDAPVVYTTDSEIKARQAQRDKLLALIAMDLRERHGCHYE